MQVSKSQISAFGLTLLAFGAYLYLRRRSRSSATTPTLIDNTTNSSNMKNYFGNSEFTNSSIAKQNGISNQPDEATWQRIYALRDNVLNPAREALGQPIYITSGYRCPRLNALVGGASNSQHVTGEAADLDTRSLEGNKRLFTILAQFGNFDQLIWEKGGEWVHVSYRNPLNNRGQMLSYNGSSYQNINNTWQNLMA